MQIKVTHADRVKITFVLYNILVSTGDYLEGSTTLTFQPGVVELTFPVSTVEDTTNELLESFAAQLSNPQGARLGDDVAVVDIRDNDREFIYYTYVPYIVYITQYSICTCKINLISAVESQLASMFGHTLTRYNIASNCPGTSGTVPDLSALSRVPDKAIVGPGNMSPALEISEI